jgi:ERCC4-type nuclease
MKRILTILVDSREQAPFKFDTLPVSLEVGALSTGDYSLPGFEDSVAVERKSLDDLVGCLKGEQRERFERELARGRAYELFALVVEGSFADLRNGRYRSEMKSEAVLQSLAAFQARYRLPICWCGTRNAAEYWTWALLEKFAAQQKARFRKLEGGQEVPL